MAQQNGFGESDVGRVALVTTELATNLIKHGGGGEILSALFRMPAAVASNSWRSIAAAACRTSMPVWRDGYSSAGTRGNGLGAVIRQSHFVDIASWPGLGTAVLARIEARHAGRRAQRVAGRLGRCLDRHAG